MTVSIQIQEGRVEKVGEGEVKSQEEPVIHTHLFENSHQNRTYYYISILP